MLKLGKFNYLIKTITFNRTISNLPFVFSKDVIKYPETSYSATSNESVGPSDSTILRINSMKHPQELLEFMKNVSRRDIEPFQLSNVLNQLMKLQRSGERNIHPSEFKKHAGFQNICKIMKYQASRMETNEVLICLKVLCYFGLPSESLFIQQLLHLLKDNINNLSLSNLVFLNFLLERFDKTPLIEALQIAIPMVFDMNMGLQMDHNNVTELADILYYISTSSVKISRKSMTNIITALTLHGSNIEMNDARSIIWSISALRRFHPGVEKLFENCIHILNEKLFEMSFEEMETTLSKLVERVHRGHFEFYHELFFNNCVQYVIQNDLGYMKASYILKKFNKIAFASCNLLEYIDKQIIDNHSLLSSSNPTGLITLASGFSNANYKTEHWEILKTLLHENPLLHNERVDIPWLRFAVEMFSVGFYSQILFEKIFSTKYLEAVLKREEHFLNHLHLLNLWQAINLLIPDYSGPQPEQRFIDDAMVICSAKDTSAFVDILADIFGGKEFIQTNVMTSYGHCLDYVISFDLNDNPIAMPCKIKNYDSLPKSQVNSTAIFFNGRKRFPLNYPGKFRGNFDLKQRTLQRLNINVVNITLQTLNSLEESEIHDYIEREIRQCLKQETNVS
ncbi:CLUMA_CG012075, isoform A [Clunio marinus]|uniref:CLUMA_CG012075, isoform A n=1 Tax=Clunio marinus TaxID=568069 RepID=A0A1J1IEV5_9DIPT|nr:CLUMA_CG012075, isoform A [Clunio marinus]